MLPRTFALYGSGLFFVLGAVTGIVSGLVAAHIFAVRYSGGAKDAVFGGVTFVGTLWLFAVAASSHLVRASDYTWTGFGVAFVAAVVVPAVHQLIRSRR